ncbi:helix-turn-helix domain-containing protein [Glaciihabitans sp. dw_435]|uniref:helix-turn-helix domain-containing protein n=1 Tax=Glaciihabitans sp. dw_435 TaxID=2720081 RepID=UPI001BD4E46F|nr:helix-turn-helix domain-containing protein [Glaciihabitans sp. dw_435]
MNDEDDEYWGDFPHTLTTADLARMLAIGRETVVTRLKNGVIPAHYIGGSWIAFTAEIRSWVQTAGHGSEAPSPKPINILEDYPEELTYRHLMTIFGKTKQTIYSWARTGAIPASNIGNRWIIDRAHLERVLRETSNHPPRQES